MNFNAQQSRNGYRNNNVPILQMRKVERLVSYDLFHTNIYCPLLPDTVPGSEITLMSK